MDSKEFGLVAAQQLFKIEDIHYGFWEDGENATLGNWKQAQEAHTEFLFKHIFIDTRILTEAVQRNRARNLADDIFRELNNGAEFDELVVKYSDDESSRYSGGTFPMYLRRDDKSTMEQLGKSFFDEVFAMSLGETSDVLCSNMGFHIIKITEKINARILGLDDVVNPQSVNKVKDQISALLAANLKTQAYQQALVGAISNLKGKADLQIFQDNLEW